MFKYRFDEYRKAWICCKNVGTSRTFYECKNKELAYKLCTALNEGTMTCRGSKELGTACGKCVKCECTIDPIITNKKKEKSSLDKLLLNMYRLVLQVEAGPRDELLEQLNKLTELVEDYENNL